MSSGSSRAPAAELDRLGARRHRILIVDDSSPDGTGTIADWLAEELDGVEVLHRAVKGGLGHAYLAGFAHALAGGAELVIEMDADFSHDPRYLGRPARASDDADLVLGRATSPGGGVRDWGLVRRLISRGGGLYARTILGVEVHDLTGGFKCIRREVLEAIDLAERARRGVRVPDRGHLPRDPGGVPRPRGPDRVRRPHRGHRARCRRRIALEAMLARPAPAQAARDAASSSTRRRSLQGDPRAPGSERSDRPQLPNVMRNAAPTALDAGQRHPWTDDAFTARSARHAKPARSSSRSRAARRPPWLDRARASGLLGLGRGCSSPGLLVSIAARQHRLAPARVDPAGAASLAGPFGTPASTSASAALIARPDR